MIKTKTIAAKTALTAVNEYILFHYPIGFTGGAPQRLDLPNCPWWIVPIVLTSPGYGVVGPVGVVAVDGRTGRVTGSTARSEVIAAGKRLREGKYNELQAAFLRARTA